MIPTPDVAADDRVYEPAEDSFLLLDCFEENLVLLRKRAAGRPPVVCEIGAGSGVVTAFLRLHVFPDGLFMATDVNPAACATIASTMEKNGVLDVDALQMSLTGGVRKNCIDVLVFNPPYVPGEAVPEIPQNDADWLDLALVGGADGMVVTWQVLDRLHEILAPGGVAYILFCARNKPDEVKSTMQQRGWRVETVILRKAGWEVLSVLQFEAGQQKSQG